MKNPYAQTLRELRDRSKRSMTDVARLIGVSRQAVANWEDPEANAPSTRNLVALASLYGTTVEALSQGDKRAHEASREERVSRLPSEVKVVQDVSLLSLPQSTDVPLMGVAVGGVSGDFSLNGEVIAHVPRPPGLRSARGIFAIHVLSDSMHPRYDPGDIVYASSLQAPLPGDDVIIELLPEIGAPEMPAYIKRLVRRTADALICEQFNPREEVVYPLGQVARLHRVMRTKELFGA